MRVSSKRGLISQRHGSIRLVPDDGTTPSNCVLWAAQRGPGRDIRFVPLWNDPTDPRTYSALFNICVVPGFLPVAMEGSHHS